ncbi:M16 family metallopeptidase [Streptomyces prunicolor]|uniref:M16 family metallopeptidase n=1 Tax=Streptomyces prunicolor TaxID=67348 RepID=UPI0034473194
MTTTEFAPEALSGLIGCTTTQGIPTLYAPRQGGQVTAGLFFRVGRADETLATAGLTHLVEHLALHRLQLADLHYNGATANTYTLFHATGDEDEVVAHLNSVCAALRDLPLARLDTEREILRTEAASGKNGANSQLPLWRYGAQGYGLSSYNELGTWSVTPDQVGDWARTRFTRENAVLWITSESVPDGLDLTLPTGTRFPAPAATSALPTTPAYICGEDGQVVLTSVVRRSTAAAVFADVLGRALFQDLRQEGGYSYAAEADYTPRDADFATLTAYADALPQKQDAVVGGFVDTLARLRNGTIAQSELDSVRGKLLKMYDVPDFAAVALPGYALNLLLGHRVLSPAEHRAELAAVTVADLREVAREAWASTLLQVPGHRGVDWAGPTVAPQYSATTVTGSGHRSLENEDVTLVIGEEGVSVTTPRGAVTVPYGTCVAMTTRPDGARGLTGPDGFSITVEPTLYRDVTPDRIAQIDAAVPEAAVVRLPARAPEHIPRPREGAPRPRPSKDSGPATWVPTWLRTVGGWLLAVVAAVVVLFGGFTIVRQIIGPDGDLGGALAVALIEVPPVMLLRRLYLVHRMRRRR